MRTCVRTHFLEWSIEKVHSVTTIWNTIVNEQWHHDIIASVCAEHEVFTPTAARSEFSYSLSRRFSIAAIVLGQTQGTDIICMGFRSRTEQIVPSESTHSCRCLKERYCLIYSWFSFIGLDPCLTICSLPNKAIKFRSHFLELWDEGFRISSKLIGNQNDIFIYLC